jgi:hypothetical protein
MALSDKVNGKRENLVMDRVLCTLALMIISGAMFGCVEKSDLKSSRNPETSKPTDDTDIGGYISQTLEPGKDQEVRYENLRVSVSANTVESSYRVKITRTRLEKFEEYDQIVLSGSDQLFEVELVDVSCLAMQAQKFQPDLGSCLS